ncbi:helix-turn-helix domain-containing protein [soil metagenome]
MDADDVNAYGQFCPISRALEVLGERWSLLIVRDLLCGANRFNDLARCNPRLSRTLLTKRLRQLERAGIVEHVGDQYLLTPAGKELEPVVFGIGAWGAKWQFDDPRDSELDPQLLMWWVHTRLDFSDVPVPRVVFEFRFSDVAERYWILHDTQGPSVCTFDPGFGIDAMIESDLSSLYEVWLGKLDLRAAIRTGRVKVTGSTPIVRRLPDIFELSHIAGLVASVDHA